MNYLQAIERENAIASLMKFDEFLAAFNALPLPVFDLDKHKAFALSTPRQTETTEGY